jgi:hypothetical protein
MDQYERWQSLDESGDLFLQFDQIANKRSNRPDLHAMILLDSIFPDREGDMICHSEHDQIWLDFGEYDSAKLTDDQIRELCMCGVWWDDGLSMFV